MFVAIAISTCISVAFYDRFWYPPDDGAYAHVASRILRGEVLHRAIQDVHAGYINFANAAALALFGMDLSSLRIPLAVLNVLEALIAYFVLQRGGPWLALAGGVAVSSLSFVQFLNPTAHWYCLFLALLIPVVMIRMARDSMQRLVALGLIVGAIAMFRQLTGVIVAIAVCSWLLMEGEASPRRTLAPRVVLAGFALLITGYVLRHADLTTALLFGLWPVALLIVSASRASKTPRDAARILFGVMLGALMSCLPLAGYHLYHGSLHAWLDDIVGAALEIPQLTFIAQQSFTSIATTAIVQLASPESPSAALNAVFWLGLIALPTINSVVLLRRVASGIIPITSAHALAWVASFYALVALHYQIPLYLQYVAGLNVVALAALALTMSARARALVATTLVATSAVALYFHAGQSLSRGVDGTISGERSEQLVQCDLPRCGLRVDPRDVLVYRQIVARILARSADDDCILALPSDAALYFVTGRCNPTRFFNSALALRTTADVEAVISDLWTRPPALLIHRPTDKYNTPLTEQLVARARGLYMRNERVEEFVLYWDAKARQEGAQQ